MQKTLNIFRYIILGGIGLTPFIALIVSGNMFFPFITGKNFAFRILIEILFGLWSVLAIFDKKYRPKKTVIFWAVAAFTFAVILSTIFGVNIYRSFWSNYERMEGLITYLHLFAYFIILGSVMSEPVVEGKKYFNNKEFNWKVLFHISLAVCTIIGIYALLQYGGKLETHQGDRLDATLGNASYLAIYVVFHIFLAVMYFFREKEWYRWLYVPLAVLFLFDLYYTATRGAILGLIGGVLLFAGIAAWFSPKKNSKTIAVACIIAIAIAGGIFWRFRQSSYVKQSPVMERFANISWNETTTQSRLVIWKMSLAGFKEKPLFGWGPENYNLVFNKYYEPILYKQEAWFDRAHNVFIDKLIENGILGLGTYLGIFGCFVYCLWARRNKIGLSVYDSASLTAMFAAYFFHNLFVFDNIVSLILFFTFLAYIHSLDAEGKIETEASDAKNIKMVKINKIDESDLGQKSAYVMIISLLMIAAIYFVNVPGILAANDLIYAFGTANVPQQQGFLESGQKAEDYYRKAFEYFKQAIARGSFGTAETQEHLSRFAINMISIPADSKINASNEFKTEVYNTAVQELKNQMVRLPGDIRTMVFLGSLYGRGGRADSAQYDNAIDIVTKAIELSPKKQMLYFELGFAYLNKGEYQKATDVLKTAFELDETYLEARKIYATATIYANQDKVAEDLMKDFGGIDAYDDRFLNAFYKMKKFDRVIAMLEKTIAGNLKDFDHRLNLAGVYLEVGRRTEAIKLLEEASALNPAFKSQGDAFIKQIKEGKNP